MHLRQRCCAGTLVATSTRPALGSSALPEKSILQGESRIACAVAFDGTSASSANLHARAALPDRGGRDGHAARCQRGARAVRTGSAAHQSRAAVLPGRRRPHDSTEWTYGYDVGISRVFLEGSLCIADGWEAFARAGGANLVVNDIALYRDWP